MSGKLKEVKTRIASVINTQQITKAMKLVAASKLKKATDLIVEMRPYSQKLSEMLANIAAATEGDVSLSYAEVREVKKALVVVITSDKGLCGGFNANVIKQAKLYIDTELSSLRAAGKVSILCIGKKGHDIFKKYDDCEVINKYVDLFKKLSFENSSEAIDAILHSFESGKYDKVVVSYAEFKNAAVQNFNLVPFLPIQKVEEEVVETKSKTKENKPDYIFQPVKEELIEVLAPKILKTQFYSYMLDSNASEHGARMTAMEAATENANDMLRELKLTYNKERQAAITTELTEIVSGAAALEGS